MKYPYAKKGVTKLFAAEIFGLIGTLSLLVTATMAVLIENSKSVIAPAMICGAAGIVLYILSYIFTLIGVGQASKDESMFRFSLYGAIFGIVYALLSSFLSNAFADNVFAQTLFSLMPEFINLFIMVFIVTGIRSLAVQMGELVMDAKGKNIMIIVFIMELIVFTVRVFAGFIRTNVAAIVAAFALGFAGLLSAVSYILYLVYLGKASKMLSK